MREVLDAVPVKVTANMNLMLDAPFAAEEVKNADTSILHHYFVP
jgi:hypothetical protein